MWLYEERVGDKWEISRLTFFRTVDRIWGEWVKEPFPVSTCVQIVRLAKEAAKVEVEVVAETN